MDIKPLLNRTKLKDRTLWFDGDSSYPASVFTNTALIPSSRFVDDLTQDIIKYNRLVFPEQQIRVKQNITPLSFDWIIPDQFKNLDVSLYLREKLIEECNRNKWDITETNPLVKMRMVRILQELELFNKRQLTNVLRVLIFIINTLNVEGVVWGVGRGSSVSSYILYLIGVHDVDSVQYNLNIDDFLH